MKIKLRTNKPLMLIILLCMLISSSACTRKLSNEIHLTEVASRIQQTREYRETLFPNERILPITALSSEKIDTLITPTPMVLDFDQQSGKSPKIITSNSVGPDDKPEWVAETPISDDLFTPEITVQEYDSEQSQTSAQTSPTGNFDNYPELTYSHLGNIIYLTQSGDTLDTVASRFSTSVSRITSISPLRSSGFLDPGISLLIPRKNRQYTAEIKIVPDSYVVLSGVASKYDLRSVIANSGGSLAEYSEVTSHGKLSGTEILYSVCQDYSINPIILLSLLDYKSHWLFDYPNGLQETDYPMGWVDSAAKGLYKQLTWAATQLSYGYYGWRSGTLSSVAYFKDPQPGQTIYFNPTLNAGSVAVYNLFAQILPWNEVETALFADGGFYQRFYQLFGNAWLSSLNSGVSLNSSTTQLDLLLPYPSTKEWSLTSGPHEAWADGSAWGALDFAPQSGISGCYESSEWITAVGDGVITRTTTGTVIEDLDGDGDEGTGWVILYLHVSTKDKVAVGTTVKAGDRIGHPSCEGGVSNGTHLHIARKYNGEWMDAGGPLPFVMSGWTAYNGNQAYKGGVYRGDKRIVAEGFGSSGKLVGY